jgi:hypothetical protein
LTKYSTKKGLKRRKQLHWLLNYLFNPLSPPPPFPGKKKEFKKKTIHDLVEFIFYRKNTFWKKEKRW